VNYYYCYKTPDGFDDIVLSSDGKYLTGLTFIDSKADEVHNSESAEYFKETLRYLDLYFNRQIPNFIPAYGIEKLTAFQKEVYAILNNVPYGETISYGQIAGTIAEKRGIAKMSAQAVGNALNRNPICIILPCHRVIGSDGSLVGYGGGLKNKQALLELERH